MKRKLSHIDLFAGCGGLSLGLEKAGFSLALAIEKSDMAAETFFHNFIKPISDESDWEKYCSDSTPILEQAKSKLIVKELQEVLNCDELMEKLKNEAIDLVAGGPPCQGFSLAGRRNPNDVRNQLPWQFLQFVENIMPKVVLIENVAGIRQNFVKHDQDAPFDQLGIALSNTGMGYLVQPVLLNAMHFGIPQHRPRVMLMGIRKDIANELGIKASAEIWKSDYDLSDDALPLGRPEMVPRATHGKDTVLTVKEALWDLSDSGYNVGARDRKYISKGGHYARQLREDTILTTRKARMFNNKRLVTNHNLRKHADVIVLRFRLYQYLRDQGIPVKVFNIAATTTGPLAHKKSIIKEQLGKAKFPAKSPDGHLIARNLDNLIELIISLATKKHSQRPLKLDEPSPTIVSLPDDFVHPTIPRTLTVRELARIQSFPDTFEFRAKETTGSLRRRFEVPQYTQVGNAVPPLMAFAVGKAFREILHRYDVFKDFEVLKEAV